MTSDATPLLRVMVRAIRREAEDINSYEFADPMGAALPPFTAGAHVEVHLPDGLIRQYSLCNDPAETHRYVVAVLREAAGRGGSRTMHDRVKVGDLLTISAPKNNFPLAEEATRHLLIAGGIGVTPLMAMIHRLERIGAPFSLHYCARTADKTAFNEGLSRHQAAGCVSYHHDGGDPSKGLNVAALLRDPPPGTHLYCCGPAGLMGAVREASAHWPGGTVHFEYFNAAASLAPGGEGEFEVVIKSTGARIPVASDQTILEALRDAGYDVESSCEAGTCGTCCTRYLSGEVDHRDFVLLDDQQGEYLMVCISRAKSKELVLDL